MMPGFAPQPRTRVISGVRRARTDRTDETPGPAYAPNVPNQRLWVRASGRTGKSTPSSSRPSARASLPPRWVLLHGFTQSGRSWRATAEALETAVEVLLPDLPGHGRSSHVHADLVGTADLIAQQLGSAAYLGYSMGARAALHLALQHPETVRALVIVGGTAGLESATDRADRRDADEQLAQKLERQGVAGFLDDWLRGPLFANLVADSEDLAGRRENTPEGLAMSLRLCGTGAQESLWHRLHEIAVPTLVVAGEADHKFTALGKRIAEAIGGNAEFVTVAGAGHAAHLERPGEFNTLLERFRGSL